MRIDVITLFPDLLQAIARYGITRRALERGMLELVTWNPRDYTVDPHRTVDDRPYGGGPGMVMKVQPLRDALNDARKAAPGTSKIIYLSPQGQRLDQERVRQLAVESGLILIAGRYEGVDQRFVDMEVEQELSIGDYVISGGELAAMVVVDAVTRLLSGALGDPLSASQDSFMNGLFDYPHYTRPENINGYHVPSVLLSGNHAAIRQWRRREALGRTWLKRPELLEQMTLTERDWRLLDEFIQVYHQHS